PLPDRRAERRRPAAAGAARGPAVTPAPPPRLRRPARRRRQRRTARAPTDRRSRARPPGARHRLRGLPGGGHGRAGARPVQRSTGPDAAPALAGRLTCTDQPRTLAAWPRSTTLDGWPGWTTGWPPSRRYGPT